MKKNENLKTPFFAKFLENQLSNEEIDKVTGGEITSRLADTPVTLKYPSDNDEAHTLKYPSDNDEVGPTI